MQDAFSCTSFSTRHSRLYSGPAASADAAPHPSSPRPTRLRGLRSTNSTELGGLLPAPGTGSTVWISAVNSGGFLLCAHAVRSSCSMSHSAPFPSFLFLCQSPRLFFPTCQVRVVRFYVSLDLRLLRSSASSFVSSSVASCDDVWSVFRVGPQQRSCEASVPRRTSTAILCVQCSAPDLNRDPVRPVFRAGPQPRSCVVSVPRRTSTAML